MIIDRGEYRFHRDFVDSQEYKISYESYYSIKYCSGQISFNYFAITTEIFNFEKPVSKYILARSLKVKSLEQKNLCLIRFKNIEDSDFDVNYEQPYVNREEKASLDVGSFANRIDKMLLKDVEGQGTFGSTKEMLRYINRSKYNY